MALLQGRLTTLVTLLFTLFAGVRANTVPTEHHEIMARLATAYPPKQSFTPGATVLEPETELAIEVSVADAEIKARSEPMRFEDRQSKLRVMVVGDSMSQGQQGDFTWRYRISQWFSSNYIAVDFVGPWKGTVAPPPTNPGPPQPPRLASAGPPPDSGGSFTGSYAATFDSDHFTAWGRACATDKSLIFNTLQGNMADMILFMLGFNDLGWFYSDANGLKDSVKTFVSEARRANPNIKIALANVPNRLFIGGRQDLVDKTAQYNQDLPGLIASMTTTQSPIYLVQLAENYDCNVNSCAAGYDGLHPNELGEYQIASAFSKTLYNGFKLGSGALTVPGSVPARTMVNQAISNFKIFSSPQGVTATWDPVYGAYGYETQSTITDSSGNALPMNWSPLSVTSNRWDTRWSSDGWTYTLKIRAKSGDTRAGPWTTAISAVAHPQMADVPRNIVVRPTSTGIDLTWSPPTGANANSIVEYNVIYFDVDSCEYLSGSAFTSSPAHIDGFKPGHHQFVAITTWNTNGEGLPAILPSVLAGVGTPSTPATPSVDVFDPTSVHITWPEVNGAAGYAIWTRNVNDAKSVSVRLNGTVPVSCSNIYFLFPGAWNYEFCISAFNGNNESPKGGCAVGPSVTTSRPGPTCAAGPQWCGGSTGGNNAGAQPPATTNSPNQPGSSPITAQPVKSNDPDIQDSYPNADWMQFTCSDPNVINANNNPSTRWSGVHTDSAWNAATSAWKAYRDKADGNPSTSFSAYIFNFFHGPPGAACQLATTQNGCGDGVQCNTPTAPGGYHIMNSFVQLARVFSNLHQSVVNAEAGVALQADKFASTFATYDGSQQKAFSLFLDLLGFGFVAFATPVWASVLKTSAWGIANKAGADIIKDESNNFANSIARVGKNFVPAQSQGEINTALKAYAGQVMDGWATRVTDYQFHLFDGTDSSINDLFAIIRDGKFLDTTKSYATDDMVNHNIRRVLWEQLFPTAWLYGTAHQFPVVLDSQATCDKSNPLHNDIPDDIAMKNFACVDNNLYYLVTGSMAAYTHCASSAHSQPVCTPNNFIALNGVGALTSGNTDWEGITVQDLIVGSVRTFKAAGSKNGAPEPDGGDKAVAGQLQDNDHSAPGLVRIPVCTVKEARTNWAQESRDTRPNYPCN